MYKCLNKIKGPGDLRSLDTGELNQVAKEIRELVIDVVSRNPGHLASNLGIVELTIALHYCYKFDTDRLVFDVGHQCYVHKILTGRQKEFETLRQHNGLSGFPNKKESIYDPFTTGHSGDAISTALGLACGDNILGKDSRVVAIVGDGGMGPGMTFEALNHAGDLKNDLLVVLNDNKLAISKTIGAFSKYLNKIRTDPVYNDLKKEVRHLLNAFPVIGKSVDGVLERVIERLNRATSPGEIFVDLGFKYFGPIDGHDIKLMIDTLKDIKHLEGPKLLHVITCKGKGFEPASMNPTQYHSAGNFQFSNGQIVEKKKVGGKQSYTSVFSNAIIELAKINSKIIGITAAMPDGTGIAAFGKKFPDRYFDVGICEQHATGLASGLATNGLKPIAAIYSTFLQRAYDQIFHDVCLQGLGVIFAIDRAGIVGNDGPTHNGVFDIAYLRHFPGMVLMAPKDGAELCEMLKLAVTNNTPIAIRYPKDDIPDTEFDIANIDFNTPSKFRIGESEIIREGTDVAIIGYGATVQMAIEAAEKLSKIGVNVTVVNSRFAKPLDNDLILDVVRNHEFVLTVEDHMLSGGFGSAVLEVVNSSSVNSCKIIRLGIPDIFVEAGPRKILLKNLGMDAEGIYNKVLEKLEKVVDYNSALGVANA
ncbi:MAG: 1-deoxy-D-xylulose-5-phosphate synthase [Candidatus Anammoxibacter sp.]